MEHSELYLVDLHFRKPEKGEKPDLVSATYALQLIGGNIPNTLNRTRISQAFAKLGFEYKHGHAQRGYKAIHRTGVEMENYRKKLAEECDTATAVFINPSRTAHAYTRYANTFRFLLSQCRNVAK